MSTPLRAEYKQTEVGEIPEDWESATVKSLAASVRNAIVGGPFGSDLVSRDYVDDGVPVIRGQNMGRRWLEGPYVYVTEKKAGSLEANLARPGDVLFTQRGTLGQVSLAPDMPYRRYLVSQSQMKVTLNGNITDPNFFLCWFVSERGQATIRLSTIQTGVPHINLGILRSLQVPIPPLPEQRAIAEALIDADALIDSLEQLVTKKRQLKQGAVQELLTGKNRLPGFSGEWKFVQLIDCLKENPAYGINAPAVPYSDKLPLYLRITDISDDGRFSAESQVSVDHPHVAQYYLSDGDLVFARTGASVGKSYLYNLDDGPLVFAGFLIRIRPNASLLICPFLAEFVKTDQYWAWVRMTSMRSGQPGINGKELGLLQIPLPSVQEQIAIATILSDMAAEIAGLEAQLAKTRSIKQGMMHKLLTGKIRLI